MKSLKKFLLAVCLMLIMAPVGAQAANVSRVVELGEHLPQSAEEIPVCKNPYDAAAYAIAAIIRYTEDKEAGEAMINKIKGPEPLNARERQILKERLNGKEYIARSYVLGTSPANGYTISAPIRIEISENSYSYIEAHYAKLFVKSSGADSPRPVVLREKPSTGEWFLWRHESLLVGTRQPAGSSAWE